jgi:hypothetical protein
MAVIEWDAEKQRRLEEIRADVLAWEPSYTFFLESGGRLFKLRGVDVWDILTNGEDSELLTDILYGTGEKVSAFGRVDAKKITLLDGGSTLR